MTAKSVAVVCESAGRAARAKEIAKNLDAPFFLGVPLGSFDLIIAVTEEQVELRSGREDGRFLALDFSRGAVNHRLRSQSRDLLLRAVAGQRKSGPQNILDVTAGFLTDSFILAGHGCRVTAIEQSPVIGALVQDALERGLQNPSVAEICGRIDFQIADSFEFMASKKNPQWDVIYLDPMFPEKKKSSLPKKELQILQELVGVGDEKESQALLSRAGKCARRVVVKRPFGAAPLLPGMTSSIKGRSIRFDVYIFS